MIFASNVLYLLSKFKEAVKWLRSKVVHSNPLDINFLEKIVPVTIDSIVLVSFLLTLNIFHTLVQCFCCYL